MTLTQERAIAAAAMMGDRRSQLVDETGFDHYDAGFLADSWRQQPMGPAYCTELGLDERPWRRPIVRTVPPCATA